MNHTNHRLALGTLFTLLIVYCLINSQKLHATSVIKNKVIDRSLFSIQASEVSGWNHLDVDLNRPKSINRSRTGYQLFLPQVNDKKKSSLSISTVLVRKLANWHQQHSTGIKINLTEKELSFGQFKSLNFAITIDHLSSFQPTIEQAQAYYFEAIKKGNIKLSWLQQLLREPAKITLTLFGRQHDDQKVSTPMATFNQQIARTSDKNRVNVSSDRFSFYWQQNYQEKAVNQEELANYKVSGILITLDTHTNQTLRSLMDDEQQDNFPETIKELYLKLALTIANPIIEVL